MAFWALPTAQLCRHSGLLPSLLDASSLCSWPAFTFNFMSNDAFVEGERAGTKLPSAGSAPGARSARGALMCNCMLMRSCAAMESRTRVQASLLNGWGHLGDYASEWEGRRWERPSAKGLQALSRASHTRFRARRRAGGLLGAGPLLGSGREQLQCTARARRCQGARGERNLQRGWLLAALGSRIQA